MATWLAQGQYSANIGYGLGSYGSSAYSGSLTFQSYQLVYPQGLAFAATTFGSVVPISAYQGASYVDETDYGKGPLLNNTQYVSPTQVKINGGPVKTISNIVPMPNQAPLKVTFSHTVPVAISNVSVQAYNLTAPESGAIPGINIWALEQGVWTTWQNINGVARTITAGTGAASYTWRFALSASPSTGNPKHFGLRFSLTYI